MKDGKALRPGDRYEIVYTLGICSLEVAACDMSDAGKYTCIAENSQGTEECMCKVTVNGTTSALPILYTAFIPGISLFGGGDSPPQKKTYVVPPPLETPGKLCALNHLFLGKSTTNCCYKGCTF